MNYNDFNEETRVYIKKVVDIYSTIENEKIVQRVRKLGKYESYEFTRFDKKILSLFVAGFMVEGNLKKIFLQYDDIKLEDFLSFLKLNPEKIKELSDDEYEKFYAEKLKTDLLYSMDQVPYSTIIINYITPEVIIGCLDFPKMSILDYYCVKYNLNVSWLNKHPLFNALKNYNLKNGSIREKTFKSVSLSNSSSPTTFSENKSEFKKDELESKKDESTSIDFNGDNVLQLLDGIKKKFVGQEEACEGLFYNIVLNQQLAGIEALPDGQRSIIFLDGPTGTGKTAITREITEKLDIPFTSTSVTNYSAAGYVGGNIIDILKELYKKSNNDIEKAQRGIIVLDEFDKIAYSRSGGLEMKRAVQQQLLDFLGGGKYVIHIGNNIFDTKEVEFDTSKLTFVCLGALTDLRTQKIETKQSIGFQEPDLYKTQYDYTITPQDLMAIGLERELVGRFNTYLHTNDYSKENLIKILKESEISPLIGFRQWIESRGKKLEVDEDVYSLIADLAYELNTGARSLQTVLNNIRTPFIKEVLIGTSRIIHLDSETVRKICGQVTNRKGRI